MVLDPQNGHAFIQGYTKLLLEIYRLGNGQKSEEFLNVLAEGRRRLVHKPSLLEDAVTSLRDKSVVIPKEVVAAVGSLRVENWVYLRDTRTYSIFLDPAATDAYGVLGLTQRIRDIVAVSGVVVNTGVVRYLGRYVCDGLVASPFVRLGPMHRESFGNAYRDIKAARRFHATWQA
jgi:hypothetical protein